jgi:hypothetical protein
MKIDLCFPIPGADLYAEISFTCVYRGARGTYYDPPEGPEFEVDSIEVFEDDPKSLNRPIPLPSWLLDSIAFSDEAATAMAEYYSRNGDAD